MAVSLGLPSSGCVLPQTNNPADTGDTDTVGTIDSELWPDTAPPCFQHLPTLAVGTGIDAYSPLTDGEPLMMVHGPQDGWHMVGALTACHLPELISVRLMITDVPSAETVSDVSYYVALTETQEVCCASVHNLYGYLNVDGLVQGEADTPPELLAGHELDVQLQASSSRGREVTSTVRVQAALDPVDVEP